MAEASIAAAPAVGIHNTANERRIAELIDEIELQQERALALAFALEAQLDRPSAAVDYQNPTAFYLAGVAREILSENGAIRTLRRMLNDHRP